MRKIKSIILLGALLSASIGCSNNNNLPYDLKIDITKNEIVIDEFNITEGDEILLSYQSNKNFDSEIEWSSSNSDIVSIDNEGKVKGLTYGTAIINLKVKDAAYICDSIYVNVKSKVEQKGVGTGYTPNDPIFLGNEGKEEPIEIYFLEMQHIYADSIYIKKGNVDVLIDTGWSYDGLYVDKFLAEHMNDDCLDLFMLSHSDGDHIDGINNALKNINNISLMVDYGGTNSGNVGSIREKYRKQGTTYYSAYDCVNNNNNAANRFYLTDEFYFDILDTGEYVENTYSGGIGNPHSVSVIFYYKDFKFFTGGDITTSTEEKLLEREYLPEVTLFKAAHHGSHGSNSQEFLNTLNPKSVAISAARANNYNDTPSTPNKNKTYNLNAASGHPAAAAIERIYKIPNISQNLNVYWNACNGTMKFTSYGENNFTFEGSPTMKGYYDLSVTNGTPKWNEELQDFENKVTGEENYRLHETKVFKFRDYIQYLPTWAQEEYFPK